jgi:ubiquilin
MGAPPNEEQMADMLSNPAIAQTMNEALNNPAFVDLMIQQNPMLASMPNAREMLQSPVFRRMMTDPDSLRMAAQLRRFAPGGPGANAAFPAPGATDTTPAGAAASESANAGGAAANAQAQNPFGAFPGLFGMPAPSGDGAGAGGAAGAANPFAALFNPYGAQPGNTRTAAAPDTGNQTSATTTSATAGSGGDRASSTGATTSSPPPGGSAVPGPDWNNPFARMLFPTPPGGTPGVGGQAGANPFGAQNVTPAQIQQAMQMLGMGGGLGGGMGGETGAFGAPSAAPPDNRPPEERYADQLRQLNDMGFFDFDRNIAALRRSGGSVQGAVEHLLSNLD